MPPARTRAYGSGAIRRLPSGRYQARFRGPDGVTRSAMSTFDTRDDAAAWLTRQARDVSVGIWEVPAEKEVSSDLRSYAEAWLAGRDLKPSTVQLYRRQLDELILPRLGDVRLERLAPTTVRNWHAALRKEAGERKAARDRLAAANAAMGEPVKAARSGETQVAQAYSLLRAIMNSAYRDDLITANPCRIERAGSTKKVHKSKPATLAELDAIVMAVPPRYQAMVLLAAWCALRFGELTELRRKDLDLDEAVVSITRGVVHVKGKAIVGTPKTDAGIRTVGIPPHIVKDLRRHLRDHVAPAPEELLFPARQGGHMVVGSLYRVFYPAREAAGRPDLRFHDLRHTGLTLFASTGATLGDLKARAGHTTAAAAMIYQHAAAGRDQLLTAKLSELVQRRR